MCAVIGNNNGGEQTVTSMKAHSKKTRKGPLWSLRLEVRTRGFHPRNRSSILLEITTSGYGQVWYGACFGSMKPGVRIPLLGPLIISKVKEKSNV